MLRIAGRRFSTISAAYANAVSKQLIKEDACQLNVVRYLDRFQRVIESYYRGPIPNVGYLLRSLMFSMKS